MLNNTFKVGLAHPELQVPDPEFDAWCDRVLTVIDNARLELHHLS